MPRSAARLGPYADAELARLVRDIETQRPDAILVGPLNTRLHAAVWGAPAVSAAMARLSPVRGKSDAGRAGRNLGPQRSCRFQAVDLSRNPLWRFPIVSVGDATASGLSPSASPNAHVVLAALAPAGAMLLIAIALQVHFGAFGEVSWLISVCEGWLDGKTPYVDMIETNPPAAILLYLPAVWLARALRVGPELAVAGFGFAVAIAMTSASTTILRHAGLMPRLAPIFWIVALFAFTILPGRAFGEREYFAVLFALPVVALWTARASGPHPSLADMVVAGLCVGADDRDRAALCADPARDGALSDLARGPAARADSVGDLLGAAFVSLSALRVLEIPRLFPQCPADCRARLSSGARDGFSRCSPVRAWCSGSLFPRCCFR